MKKIRRQLTLFITEQNEVIEAVRATFNPAQYALIAAHVTLCREDEIENLKQVIENIEAFHLESPVQIMFTEVMLFEEGKGVLIPAKKENDAFHALRKAVLPVLRKFSKAPRAWQQACPAMPTWQN